MEVPEETPRALPAGIHQRDSFLDSILTDAALSELKKQSVDGCLLCTFDAWDTEEWG